LLALGNSKHTAPPQLLDDTPLAPLATKTEQLLNSKAYKLTFKSATLLTCIAPPPPLDEPGLTALTFVKTEHAVKLEFKMKTVKLDPDKLGALRGRSRPVLNAETWGE
jgi:hypothetical protein